MEKVGGGGNSLGIADTKQEIGATVREIESRQGVHTYRFDKPGGPANRVCLNRI
jgi:hypothetical protein